jgi:hypothetical protein
MKRILIGLVLVISLIFPTTSSVNAAAKKFKNCTELNKVYPGGVALPGAINAGGITKKEPNTIRLCIMQIRNQTVTEMG